MTLPLTKFSMPSMIFSVTLRQLGVPLNPPAGHFSRLSISVALPIHPYKYCMICVISQIYFRLFHSKSTNFMKIAFGTNENWGFHAGHTSRLCLLTTLSLLSESRSYILRNYQTHTIQWGVKVLSLAQLNNPVSVENPAAHH